VKARPPLAALRRALSLWLVMQVASKRTAWTMVNTLRQAGNKRLMCCNRAVSKLPRACSPARNNTTDLIRTRAATRRVLIPVGTQQPPESPLQRLELRSVLQRQPQLELTQQANPVPCSNCPGRRHDVFQMRIYLVQPGVWPRWSNVRLCNGTGLLVICRPVCKLTQIAMRLCVGSGTET
jgi:hypothetical protein